METPPPPSAPRALYGAMACQYAVGGAFLPFLTLYLQDRGLDFSQLGWTYFTTALVGSTVPFLWGVVADKWLPVELLLALLHAGGAAALLVLAHQVSFAGLIAALGTVFAFYIPTGALLSALAYHRLLAPDAQFGALRLWGSIGWMLPSLPVFIWLALDTRRERPDLSFVLYIAAALEAVTAVICLRLSRTPAASRAHLYRAALKQLVRRPGFGTLLAVIFFAHASFAVLFYYSPSFLEAAGFARKWIGPVQSVGVAVEVPFLVLLPHLIRRLGYHGTIVVGCLMLLLRQVIYASAAPPWLLAASYVLAGACVAFYLTAVSLAINAMAGREVRATAQTVVALVGPGLGQMFGHQASGRIASVSELGLRGAFVFASLAAGAALLLLWALRRKGPFSSPHNRTHPRSCPSRPWGTAPSGPRRP